MSTISPRSATPAPSSIAGRSTTSPAKSQPPTPRNSRPLTTPPAPPTAPASHEPIVSAERIRARAYEIFQARSANTSDGDAVSDWVQAECELNGCSHNPAACSSVSHK